MQDADRRNCIRIISGPERGNNFAYIIEQSILYKKSDGSILDFEKVQKESVGTNLYNRREFV